MPFRVAQQWEKKGHACLFPAGSVNGLWATEAELQRLLRIQAALPTTLQQDSQLLAGDAACMAGQCRRPLHNCG